MASFFAFGWGDISAGRNVDFCRRMNCFGYFSVIKYGKEFIWYLISPIWGQIR